jgi:hypothetical protein
MGSTCLSSRKYLSTVIPLCVTAKTTRRFPMVRSSTRPCLIRKSRYSLRTLQFTFALYMMCVSFSGPRCARTFSMSTYISSLLRLMLNPLLAPNVVRFYIYHLCILNLWFFHFSASESTSEARAV